MDYKQKTLKEKVGCTGIGLHTGKRIRLNIRPARIDTGIKFIRTDLAGRPTVKAHFDNVIDTTLATTIGNKKCRVSTIEHLMATFFGLGIDNAVVELDGPEVPIMDGSAKEFTRAMTAAGVVKQDSPKHFIIVKKPIQVQDQDKSVVVLPEPCFKITCSIDFTHPLIGKQKIIKDIRLHLNYEKKSNNY